MVDTQEPEEKYKVSPFVEVGKSGVKWSYGHIYDEFLTVLQGTRGIKIFREMSDNDSIIGSCLFAIKQILREARWSIKPGDDTDAACKKDAEFVENDLKRLEHTWADFIVDALSMLIYGWSYFEQVYYIEDGKIHLKKVAQRKQSSFEKWALEDNGDLLGLWQRSSPSYQSFYIPAEKAIHFRTELNSNNPEGRSILRNAYRAWYFKKNLEEIEGIGVERDLAGIPLITPPQNFDMSSTDPQNVLALQWAKKMLSSIRRDEQDGILVPFGWELSLLSSPGKRQFDTTEIINRYNKEMAVTVLAQFVMLGMERTGSFALAKEQTSMFYLCLEGWMDSMCAAFNQQVIKRLFKLNNVTDDMRPLPYAVHTNIRNVNLRDLADYVSSLAKVDALIIDDDLRVYLKDVARLEVFKETSNKEKITKEKDDGDEES